MRKFPGRIRPEEIFLLIPFFGYPKAGLAEVLKKDKEACFDRDRSLEGFFILFFCLDLGEKK